MLIEIETARLRLRQFRPDDLEPLSAMRADREVMRYIGNGEPHDRETTRAYLERNRACWEQHGFGRWAVEFKDERTFAGWCGLALLDNTEEVEIGYGVAREYWGRGLITEAGRASLHYGFSTLGLPRIVAVALPENIASRRVMEKLGMKYVRPAFFYGVDVVYYAINRDDFLRTVTSDE